MHHLRPSPSPAGGKQVNKATDIWRGTRKRTGCRDGLREQNAKTDARRDSRSRGARRPLTVGYAHGRDRGGNPKVRSLKEAPGVKKRRPRRNEPSPTTPSARSVRECTHPPVVRSSKRVRTAATRLLVVVEARVEAERGLCAAQGPRGGAEEYMRGRWMEEVGRRKIQAKEREEQRGDSRRRDSRRTTRYREKRRSSGGGMGREMVVEEPRGWAERNRRWERKEMGIEGRRRTRKEHIAR